MKHYVCVDCGPATPMAIGGGCPRPDCRGIITDMNRQQWTMRCSAGCRGLMPSLIAHIEVSVEFEQAPYEECE